MRRGIMRHCAAALVVACCSLVSAHEASSQTVIITMYNDIGAGSSLQAYVGLADESDLATWGAVHYNYYTYASIDGTSGSDEAEGGGLGGLWMEVPLLGGDEGEWSISAVVTFDCSQAGPIGGALPSEPVLGSAYRHHYDHYSTDYPFYYYSRHSNSDGRLCSLASIRWSTFSAIGLTVSGVAYRIPGVVAICPGLCAAGQNGAVIGPSGTSGAAGVCN